MIALIVLYINVKNWIFIITERPQRQCSRGWKFGGLSFRLVAAPWDTTSQSTNVKQVQFSLVFRIK